MNQSHATGQSHSLLMGYALWLFGFLGAHRFYYGKKASGVLYLCTAGLLGFGWIFDLFWMPMLARSASRNYHDGEFSFDVAWLLQTYVGYLGIHRFYLGKWASGLLWLFTGGLFGVGYIYDYLTLNEQVSVLNRA